MMTRAAAGRSRPCIAVSCLRLGLSAGLLVPGQPCYAANRSNPVHVTLPAGKAHHPKHRKGKTAAVVAPAAVRRPAPTQSPTPVTTATPPGPSASPEAPAISTYVAPPVTPSPSIEAQIVALTNQARVSSGLPALEVDGPLGKAALIQAAGMATLDVMDHTLPSMPQPTLSSRLQYVGYSFAWAGENIAVAAPDAATLVAFWLNSPEHRANILSPYAVSTGVAVICDSQGMPYFCQVFGAPSSAAGSVP
jgi:uncharacterized protein YkwD